MSTNVNLSINSENEFMPELKGELKLKSFLKCEKFEFKHKLININL